MCDRISELDKTRLDIAWKWFELHAKLRSSLFNYFLVITGILINAYVLTLRDNLLLMSIMICIFGMLQAAAFFIFDVRSRQLVRNAEDVIERIESTTLFTASFNDLESDAGRRLGLLIADRQLDMREGASRSLWKRMFKMKTGIRAMQCIVVFLFALGIVIAVIKHCGYSGCM